VFTVWIGHSFAPLIAQHGFWTVAGTVGVSAAAATATLLENQKGDIDKYLIEGKHQPGGSSTNYMRTHGGEKQWYKEGLVAHETAFKDTPGLEQAFSVLNVRHAAATVNIGGNLFDSAEVSLLAPLKGHFYIFSPWTGSSHQAFFNTLMGGGIFGWQALSVATSHAGWSFYLTISLYGINAGYGVSGIVDTEVKRK